MGFEYYGREYDIRFKTRYLPFNLKTIDRYDVLQMMSNITKESKQILLDKYIKGAKVL